MVMKCVNLVEPWLSLHGRVACFWCVCCMLGFVCGVCIKCDRNFAVWDVLREEEFSPLKNADGAAKDTPTTCRNDLCSLHRRYAMAAGAIFVHADGTPYPDIQRSVSWMFLSSVTP